MGEPFSLRMRGLAPSHQTVQPAPSAIHHPSRIIRVAGFFSLQDGNRSVGISSDLPPSILVRDTPPKKIDWIDKVTWAGEAVAIAGGIFLVSNHWDSLPSRGIGMGLLAASGENIAMEISDRFDGRPHATRKQRMLLSLAAGLFVGTVSLFITDFEPGGAASGNGGRNPTTSWGP